MMDQAHQDRIDGVANVALIKSVYEAFGRGDVDFIASRVTREARWDFNVAKSDVPWHQPAVGPGGLPTFIGNLLGNVELEAFEPRHFVAAGDDVIAHVRIAMTVRRTGRRIDEEQLHWWKVRDGRIEGLRHFEDTAQVVAAWQGGSA
jgi:ketosteroid isomerase-like protein